MGQSQPFVQSDVTRNAVTVSRQGALSVAAELPRELEVRVHGRGGQGGVTCAKLIAALYAGRDRFVQTFGDYASERSGAPVRAYTRISARPVRNRNKVYAPDQLLILDCGLAGPDLTMGLKPGGLVLVNTPEPTPELEELFAEARLAWVDATGIARRHKIGTRSVVIVNTTIIGAYARLLGFDFADVERVFTSLGLQNDLPAARAAFRQVRLRDFVCLDNRQPEPVVTPPLRVPPLTEQQIDPPLPLKTGSWRTQRVEYQQRPAPCNGGCPAGNDVVGFIQALRADGVEAAGRILLRTQPLPSVCGRVCPAPCMGRCNRAELDGAVNIRGLERWVGDHLQAADMVPETPKEVRSYAVVGSGPAGLSATWSLALAGHRVTLLERAAKPGGLLRYGIPEYRLPQAMLDKDIERILDLGVDLRCGVSVDAGLLESLVREHDGVLVATGLDAWRAAGIPGEDLAGVEQGLAYLERAKAGGDVRLSGHVLVVGGGNSAIDAARTALRQGAERVTLAYRRGRTEMPAIVEEIEEALHEGVQLHLFRQPVSFDGNGRVERVVLAEVEPGAPDADGRRRPVVTDKTEMLAVDHVLLCLGQGADTSLLPEGWTMTEGAVRDGSGRLLSVVVCGDLATSEGTVTHAIGDGRRAALRLLAGRPDDRRVGRPVPGVAVSADEILFDVFERSEPARDRHLPEYRLLSGDEVNLGLPDASEAERCFSCGHCTRCDTCLIYCPEGVIRRCGDGYDIDEEQCKGCGICAQECPRHALRAAALQGD